MIQGNWDLKTIEKKMKALLPPSRKASPTDAPVPVIEFRGIPVSYYAAPLEKDPSPDAIFAYREMARPKEDYNVREKFREINGRMVVVFPEEMVRKGRFIIALQSPAGILDPVVETGNGGRAAMRCKTFSQLFQVAFDENRDQFAIPEAEYRKLVLVLGTRKLI